MRKIAIACCAIVLVASLISAGLSGCTRAKPEPKPTIPIAALTPARTASPGPPRGTTTQAAPTKVLATAGPTVISAAETTPTAVVVVTTATTAPGPAAATPTTVVVSGEFEYTVQWGDTLFSVARRFNTTVEAIVALNGLPDANFLKIGQVLKISGTSPAAPGPAAEYVVQAGDTLYSIARRYGTTVEAIRKANGIVNPWFIRVGQKLVIPQGGATSSSTGTTYVVQPGDTLYAIAARYGKNAWDIIVANNLSDPYWLSVGQVLLIP